MFDITTLAAEETATLDLLNGQDEALNDDKGNRLSITLYGPGSKSHANAQAKRNNRTLERLRKKGKTDLSAEEQASETAEFLAACTVSFNGWEYSPAKGRGEKEHFKAAYSDPGLGFIRDQVAEFIGDWANFTKGSAKT